MQDLAVEKAKQLISQGNVEEALVTLQGMISSKKVKAQQHPQTYQRAIDEYFNICLSKVELFKFKEIFIHFRNIFQHSTDSPLKYIIQGIKTKLINNIKSELPKYQNSQIILSEIPDFEKEYSPEELLGFAYSSDFESKYNHPFIKLFKFSWNIYKIILDNIKFNYQLLEKFELVYEEALTFLLDNNRKREVRKLIEILSDQMNLSKQYFKKNESTGTQNIINLKISNHYELLIKFRFKIVDLLLKAHLHSESIRVLEDINYLITFGKSMNYKPSGHENNYFINLSTLFLQSKLYLFHSFSIYKTFNIVESKKKKIERSELSEIASKLALSCLSIPLQSNENLYELYYHQGESAIYDLQVDSNSTKRVSEFFLSSVVPSREFIIQDIIKRNIISLAHPEIKQLFLYIRPETLPLDKAQNHFQQLNKVISLNSNYKIYEEPLRKLIMLKILKSVAYVYKSIRMEKLTKLLPGSNLKEIEEMLASSTNSEYLYASIDYKNKLIFLNPEFKFVNNPTFCLKAAISSLVKSADLLPMNEEETVLINKRIDEDSKILIQKELGEIKKNLIENNKAGEEKSEKIVQTKPKEIAILKQMKEKTIEKETEKKIKIERHQENVHSLANKKKAIQCEDILKKKPNIRILELNNIKLSNVKDVNLLEEKWLTKILEDIKSKEENVALRNIDRDIKIIDGCVRFHIITEFNNLINEIPTRQETVNNTIKEFAAKKSKEIESMNQIVQNLKGHLSIHIQKIEDNCKEIYDQQMKEYLKNKIPKIKGEILKKAKDKYEEYKKKQLEDKKKDEEIKANEQAVREEKAKKEEKRQWVDYKNRGPESKQGEDRNSAWRTKKPTEMTKDPSPTKYENTSNEGFHRGVYLNKNPPEEKKRYTYDKKGIDSYKNDKEANESLGNFRRINPPKETKSIEKAKPKKAEGDEEDDFKIVKGSKK